MSNDHHQGPPNSNNANAAPAISGRQIVIPIRSDSTEWNSTVHDYGTALDRNESDRSRNMRSLFDIPSPTSIYTTESAHDYENDSDAEEGEDNDYGLVDRCPRSGKKLGPNVPTRRAVFPLWTKLTEGILHRGVTKMVIFLSTTAAKFPFTTIGVMSLLSFCVLGVGFFTNFQLIVDTNKMFTPMNSPAVLHHEWLMDESGFNNIRPIMMIIHADGANVLGKKPLQRLFQAVDTVRDTFGYDHLCHRGTYVDYDGVNTCRILAATRFWDQNTTLFYQQVKTDQDAIDIMSANIYQNSQTPVFHEMILGNYKMSNETDEYQPSIDKIVNYENSTAKLVFVQSYVVRLEIPDVGDEADLFENLALDRLKDLKNSWERDNTTDLHLDFLSIYAYEIENQRALIQDLPLVSGIFLVLVIFTTLVFHKRHKVYSRSMLGCASLITIGSSLALSYGAVWILGIPFTNVAQILPFMVMGVGLDDTFIITGEYFRTDPNLDVVKRIEQTMHEVGISITLTSLTTMLAFALGSLSEIPAVRWLCFYAFAAIAADYVFQITYFIALLVLDERRVQAHQQNCCFWRPVPRDNYRDEEKSCDDSNNIIPTVTSKRLFSPRVGQKHFSERFMNWYADQLMRPISKVSVLLIFGAYFGFCVYRSTKLTQEFNVEDYVPSDSYLRGTLDALAKYYSLTKPFEVYFRDIDQSDPGIQHQMRDYIDQLAALHQIGQEPPFCWVRDFPKLKQEFPFEDENYAWIGNLTFNQQVRVALNNPTIREIYGQDIVLDEERNITASRCLLFLRNINLESVKDQIDMLQGQRAVTERQPINQDRDEWAFFSFDPIFFYWELYASTIRELLSTIVSGIAAVAAVTFVLIPHWSAIGFVLPGICVLYVNFLGTMQLMGLHINSLTYVIVVMAVGILVDFLVHILHRYYETTQSTKNEKVKDTLRTMGASIFVGGATTFLSVIPLVLSTTYIFMTVFWAFLGIVLLGFTHGLILLPVVLSLIGPVATHQGSPQPAIIPDGILTDEAKDGDHHNNTESSTSSSAPSSSSSAVLAGNDKTKKDKLRSSTDDVVEVLRPNVKSEESLVKGETYEEKLDVEATPDMKKKCSSVRKSDPVEEEEDEGGISITSSGGGDGPRLPRDNKVRQAIPMKKEQSVAEPTGMYCGADFARFNLYDLSLVQSCARADCKTVISPTNACKAPLASRKKKSSGGNGRDAPPMTSSFSRPRTPRRSRRDPPTSGNQDK